MKFLYTIFLFYNLVLTLSNMMFFTLSAKEKPLVSIITSIYKGDEFIEGFMADIVSQTIFKKCELILINANSPGKEEIIIEKYLNKYPNIKYIKLEKDPGLYGVWNIGISLAKSDYITNANIDDRLRYDTYQEFVEALDKNPGIDLVYSDMLITNKPNETFEHNSSKKQTNFPNYSLKAILEYCLPNNHPMWCKSMHNKYGLFDESFKAAGDRDMWLRAASQGAKFLKVPGVHALYYKNPKGLSTSREPNHRKLVFKEYRTLMQKYQKIFATLGVN